MRMEKAKKARLQCGLIISELSGVYTEMMDGVNEYNGKRV